ncbi:glycosyltransferase family 4 protein [Corynebacterium halotolerans]|uniref:Group 1 glycosyl transferase n=1 Tax=Corynebacterium halotolerans YIM 70093 = DSM 44683 TaxID=1121362 RepID=M1MZD7_9CORY|nr:glycosyltransferase family 4 protein [Corynebacterium halotolerans]AGF73054.1 group 1 glycosyl transferase [Corynebacterium halotolerans YIM 70093 = DSM 44683]
MNPLFTLRILSLLVTASARLVTEDLSGFLAKLSERIRTSDNPVLSRIPSAPLSRIAPAQTPAREITNRGELSEGIALIDAQGGKASRSDRHLAQRTRERLEQLRVQPPAPVAQSSTAAPPEHRVLHVLTNSLPYTHSGYTLRSHNVLKAIQQTGIPVHAVTRLAYPVLVGKFPDTETQTIGGISYERLLPWSYPLSLQDRDDLAVEMIVERARAFGATVLHTTTDFKNAIVTSRAAEHLGIPWVYEVRGELESTWLSRQPAELQERAQQSEFYQLARSQETRYAQAANAVVTLSEISKQQLIDRGIEAGKIHVVPNAVDEQFIGRKFDRSAIRRELGLPDVPLVGSVTAVVDYEGLDTLIQSLQYLPAGSKVLIVGEGTARPALEELTASLGLDDRVIFAGRKPQNEIWKWYAALDLFVVPRKDTQVCRTVTPIKPLMAQSLGIPVVASELPALREVTGGFAEYVAPENAETLAKGISTALHRKDLSSETNQWIRSRTWRMNGTRYRELYGSF